MTNFQKALAFVGLAEGGYSDDENDNGNWTGGKKGVGELKGTKYGISAASYQDLDIKNLTKEQADNIYKKDYWDTINGDKLPWPLALVAFDHAVNAGVARAREALKVYSDPFEYIASRLNDYTTYGTWAYHGKGWTRRMANLQREVIKELSGMTNNQSKSQPEPESELKPRGWHERRGNVDTVVLRLPNSVAMNIRGNKLDLDLTKVFADTELLS